MNVETRQRIERQIVRQIVKDAIASNYSVSVYDGEEWTLKCSSDLREIMRAVMTTDEDVLRIRAAENIIGSIDLIYGNDGWDVISDHTANDAMDALLVNASKLSHRLCIQYA